MRTNIIIIMVILLTSFKPLEKEIKLTKQEFYSKIIGKKEIIDVIFIINQKYNLEVELLIALCYIESGFNKYAVGVNKDSVGKIISKDHGLFQLNDVYFKSPGIYHPIINTAEAITYFNECMKVGSVEKALMLYNSGNIIETISKRKYIDNILLYAMNLKEKWIKYSNIVN